jgi:quercetin dioxygenase-like cupin family protein
MHKHKLESFTRGWIVGDFEPSIIKTKDFEFMVRNYEAGESELRHTHKQADEITIVVFGRFIMNDQELLAGDIVHILPGEDTDFQCLEPGATAVVKTPSIIGDKYLV